MKKIVRYAYRVLLWFFAVLLVYLLFALVLSMLYVKAEKAEHRDVVIYIHTNGIHTDIVVPVKTSEQDWSLQIPYKNTLHADSTLPYIAFGWGDKEFYLNVPEFSDLTTKIALKAAFGLSPSAMHISYLGIPVEGQNTVRLVISNDQYIRLVNFIEASMKLDDSGKPALVPTRVHYNNYDAFYEARGRYSLFCTCNTWVNNALKAAGQKACWWTPSNKGIFYHYH